MMENFLATILSHPALETGVNLLLQSFCVLLLFLLLGRLLGGRQPAAAIHMLYMSALVSTAVLPALHAVTGFSGQTPIPLIGLVLTVSPDVSQNVASQSGFHAGAWAWVYLLPCVWLWARMGVALMGIRKLSQAPLANADLQTLLTECQSLIGVDRAVALRISSRIDSPVSFGLRPQIILPPQAVSWRADVLRDVLLHELAHVRRLDWLTMLTAYLIASLYWINPLAWLTLRRLGNAAEHSCDAAVLQAGRSETEYARSLLNVAQACFNRERQAKGLAVQTMLQSDTFKIRITQLLEDNMMKRHTKKEMRRAAVMMTIVSAATLMGVSSMQVTAQNQPLSLQIQEQEILPLNTIVPPYPQEAVDAAIEGWVQVKFTIDTQGAVDSSSVEIVDAEPTGIFDETSIQAINQFVFRPRIRQGEAVAVPGVQYVFRYELENPAGASQ